MKGDGDVDGDDTDGEEAATVERYNNALPVAIAVDFESGVSFSRLGGVVVIVELVGVKSWMELFGVPSEQDRDGEAEFAGMAVAAGGGGRGVDIVC